MISIKKGFIGAAVMVSMTLALTGCGTSQSTQAPASKEATEQSGASSQPTSTPEKLKVVTSFYPMYDFTRNVTGELAEVENLIPSGVEPHDWEPTPQDLVKLEQADVFVYNSPEMETWVKKVLDGLQNKELKVIEAAKGIELMESSVEEEEEHHEASTAEAATDEHAQEEEHHHDKDPHVWLDPVLAQQEVATIQQGLAEVDAAHADAYQKNATLYQQKLQELDQAYRDALLGAPTKEFVTQHAAFGYLAKRYNLTQVAIAGLSPEEEPTPARVAEIVQFAREKQVRVIYFETLVSPKVAQVVATEIGATPEVLNPLEGLTKEEQAQHLDYIGVMKKNLEALKKSLLAK